jgi:23S rRNA pseudouridine2605 synthase
VTVDGEPARLGQRIDTATARVEVDGNLIPVAPDLVYYLLNKPDGVVTTADDPQGRPTVVGLVPTEPRVFPVGRLDRHTEGLLILTNDALRQGVELDDGLTAPAEVGVLAEGVLRLVIHEGRNRQVRRMCEAIGHPVQRLVRTRIGPVRDTTLAPGRWRALSPGEVQALAASSR